MNEVPDADIARINVAIESPSSPIFVYIYSNDCTMWGQMAPLFENLRSEFSDVELGFLKANATLIPDLWDAFGVRVLPSFLSRVFVAPL